ncbi:hypothetical protein [Clostridium sp.]|nr:hypothetical protein [Clostridium sp.]
MNLTYWELVFPLSLDELSSDWSSDKVKKFIGIQNFCYYSLL